MYRVGDFEFFLDCEDISIPENMKKFEQDSEKKGYQYRISLSDKIELKENHFHIQRSNIKVIKHGKYEKRYLYEVGKKIPYAVSEELDDIHMEVKVDKKELDLVQYDPAFVSLLSLEKRMYEHQAYILHSSYMVCQEKAILFTAPSGTGKSTQAGLWEKYRGTYQVNGDRTLIKKEEGNYDACGFPVCGSSKICHNEKHRIHAIVILGQGKKNRIEPISYKEKVFSLLKEFTVNYQNEEFFYDMIQFIEELIQHVPVYHLICDMSEDAVECLEKQLIEDKILKPGENDGK